ncbi:RNA-binding protein [Taibaiella sp. KBW10]|uniref:RNA-binding S4 domain-containing protein n=1 Tax=Taibaiella sp. KBW10 TaxID=2153357 RepID=UPI000F5B4489|nr:RNA-binding S4 domain-containing protein [Taibaiella sp. KBW10]RQO30435.1 RNA-binding protein [Taibaiella sp. KBW10]
MADQEKLRIDKYLWSIRVFKTRSLATEACDSGRVKMNEQSLKASKSVNIGETYEIKTSDRKWIIKVTGLLLQRKAFSEAVQFYEDLTPEEDKTNTKSESSSFYTGKRLSKVGRPTKKQRRGWDDIMDEP